MSKPSKPLKFEQALGQLEKIVEKLEGGDLPLEDSLKVFEEGMELSKFCEEKLSEAEGKVEMLVKDRTGKKIVKKVDVGEELEGEDKGTCA